MKNVLYTAKTRISRYSVCAYAAISMILLTGFPLLSVALTTWACVSPQIAIVIMAVVSPLILVCYYIMDKKHLKSPSPSSDKHVGVEYTALDANKGSYGILNLLI